MSCHKSLAPGLMSHVNFKKWSCHPVQWNCQEPPCLNPSSRVGMMEEAAVVVIGADRPLAGPDLTASTWRAARELLTPSPRLPKPTRGQGAAPRAPAGCGQWLAGPAVSDWARRGPSCSELLGAARSCLEQDVRLAFTCINPVVHFNFNTY